MCNGSFVGRGLRGQDANGTRRLQARGTLPILERMKWHGLLALSVALVGCDPVVSTSGTDGGSSSSGSGWETTDGPPLPTTSIPDPSTTTGDPEPTTSPVTIGPDGTSSSGYESSTSDYGSSSTGYESSTSTDGASSSGGESSGSSGVSFIDPTGDPNGECDPYLQDCPEGEKCNAFGSSGGAWDSLGCFPVDPEPGQPGDACTVEESGTSGMDSCDVASMCWDIDEDTLEGTCIAMCTGSAAMPICADPSTTCVISNGGSLNLCLPICDPVMQDCPGGQACYPIDNTFVCAPDASGDQGMAGEPCDFINACDPGNGCIEPDTYGPGCPEDAAGCCSPFCATDAPLMCPEGTQECIPWYDEGDTPPGFDTVGVCSVPA